MLSKETKKDIGTTAVEREQRKQGLAILLGRLLVVQGIISLPFACSHQPGNKLGVTRAVRSEVDQRAERIFLGMTRASLSELGCRTAVIGEWSLIYVCESWSIGGQEYNLTMEKSLSDKCLTIENVLNGKPQKRIENEDVCVRVESRE